MLSLTAVVAAALTPSDHGEFDRVAVRGVMRVGVRACVSRLRRRPSTSRLR